MTNLESGEAVPEAIELTEYDWAVRIGQLQLAASRGVHLWMDAEGEYSYKITESISETDADINYLDLNGEHQTIFDPTLRSTDGDLINPGHWTLGRSNSADTLKKSLDIKYSADTLYIIFIDERERNVKVFEEKGRRVMNSSFEVTEEPQTDIRSLNQDDFDKLVSALDDLKYLLSSI